MLRYLLVLGFGMTTLGIGCIVEDGDGDGDGGEGGGGESDDRTTTTTSGSSGSETTGSGVTSGGAVVTCADLCALAPSTTPEQDTCVAAYVEQLGYPTNTTLSCKALLVDKTESQCNVCYGDIDITDAHCAETYATCF